MIPVRPVVISLSQNDMFHVVVVLVIMDIVFGCLRALRQKKFNSTIGIDGMIRKAGMLLSLAFLLYLDSIIHFNLVGFVPDQMLEYMPVQTIGLMEFFAFVYSVYEVLSVLKNMALSGLPVEKIWKAVEKFLKANTDELICLEEDNKKKKETTEGSDEDARS